MPASIALGIVHFVYIGVAALSKDVPPRSPRLLGALLAGLALAGVIATATAPWPWGRHFLNWLPGVYLLAGYWLPARLPARTAPGLERRLREWDAGLFDAGLRRRIERAPRPILEYLEAAYLCCYAVVPAGLVWLYLAGESREADRFWTAVLAAALPCYAALPWLQTRPPRSVEGPSAMDGRRPVLRRVNLRVLQAASVGSNTFPSGHAAAALAAALAVGSVSPVAGAAFGAVALSIAVASVTGRYHYALDAALGLLAGLAGFLASRAV